MKRNYLLNILPILLVGFVLSCNRDEVNLEPKELRYIQAELVEGRLHFKDENAFKQSIETLKDLEEELVRSELYTLYEQGFEPLFPFYKEDDLSRIEGFIEKKKARLERRRKILSSLTSYRVDNTPLASDNDVLMEEDDDLISDDYFAAMLNFDREIIVDNQLYQYTHEGAFKVPFAKSADLYSYKKKKGISDFSAPNLNELEPGLVNVTPTVQRFIAPAITNICAGDLPIQRAGSTTFEPFYNELIPIGGCGSGGGGGGSGGGGGGGGSSPDHRQSMLNYMKGLEPCNTRNGGVFGISVFGPSKKCFSEFDRKHRVKTKYWNENLLFYRSIGVKVKHQRKNCCWWSAKATDEIALTINQAIFKVVHPAATNAIYTYPHSGSSKKLFYIDGKVFDKYNTSPLVINQGSHTDMYPDTPFDEEIIVQDARHLVASITDNQILNKAISKVEADQIKKWFWDGAYSTAKSIVKGIKGKDPTKMTYIVNTPKATYIQYTNLERRRLGRKKIVDVLDHDWGGSITFKLGIKNDGSVTMNYKDWLNPLKIKKNFEYKNLHKFEGIHMDFVGLARRGNTWRGSRLVYKRE